MSVGPQQRKPRILPRLTADELGDELGLVNDVGGPLVAGQVLYLADPLCRPIQHWAPLLAKRFEGTNEKYWRAAHRNHSWDVRRDMTWSAMGAETLGTLLDRFRHQQLSELDTLTQMMRTGMDKLKDAKAGSFDRMVTALMSLDTRIEKKRDAAVKSAGAALQAKETKTPGASVSVVGGQPQLGHDGGATVPGAAQLPGNGPAGSLSKEQAQKIARILLANRLGVEPVQTQGDPAITVDDDDLEVLP